MSTAEKNIIETYSELFEGLSSLSKKELIEVLNKSLKIESSLKEKSFFKSFGAFSSEKPAEEIISDLKKDRNFIHKDLKF